MGFIFTQQSFVLISLLRKFTMRKKKLAFHSHTVLLLSFNGKWEKYHLFDNSRPSVTSEIQCITLQYSDYCINRLTSSVRPLSLIICRNTSGGMSFSLLVLKGSGSHGSRVLSKASLLKKNTQMYLLQRCTTHSEQ
jgi:hypothetical protein